MKKLLKIVLITAVFVLMSTALFAFSACKCKHEWSEWQEVTAAQCEREGAEERTCNKCGEKEKKSVPALGHDVDTFPGMEATCLRDGRTEQKHCHRCNNILVQSEVIPALGHKYENGKCVRCDDWEPTEGLEIIDYGYGIVVGFSSETPVDVYIPRNVMEIDDNVFANSNILSVTMGGVEKIGSSAFYNCKNLTRVIFPDKRVNISSYAFGGCDNLQGVYITDLRAWCETNFLAQYANPLYIAKKLYLNDKLVTDLVVPEKTTMIGGNTFENCHSITSVTIPDSVESIRYDAFAGCMNLKKVTFGEGLTKIGNSVFASCYNLTEIDIPGGVKGIGYGVFYNCKSLKKVTFPNSVTKLEARMFVGCESLTEIEIPDSVQEIEYDMFYGCKSLKKVTFGKGLTKIGENIFAGCESLTDIYFKGTPEQWAAIEIGENNDVLKSLKVNFI